MSAIGEVGPAAEPGGMIGAQFHRDLAESAPVLAAAGDLGFYAVELGDDRSRCTRARRDSYNFV